MFRMLSALLELLLPAQGRRRAGSTAPTAPTKPVPTVVPAPTPPPRPHIPPQAPAGDRASLRVRPYLVAWEAQREVQRQRERRTALAMAAVGLDFEAAA